LQRARKSRETQKIDDLKPSEVLRRREKEGISPLPTKKKNAEIRCKGKKKEGTEKENREVARRKGL